MAAKTTIFTDAAEDGALGTAARWDNGLPSRANGDTAVINNVGSAGVPAGTISAKRLKILATSHIDLAAVTLDIDEIQLGDAGPVLYYRLPVAQLRRLRNYPTANIQH